MEKKDAYNTSDTEERQTQVGETQDAVFGAITEDGPNYRDVGWLGTSALMMKTQIGLGVLSIPKAFDALGLVPGVILLLTIATITTWGGYVVGCFKLNHPEVYGIDDAGHKMFGRWGRDIFGVFFYLYWVFVAGSAMLSVSISLNALSNHGACTAVFVAVALIVGFLLSSIRTLARITWIAWIGVGAIVTAIFTVTIAVAVQDRPADAPKTGSWSSDYKVTGNSSFTDAITAISTLVFAYAATPAFFSIASEMRDPKYYTRALLLCQGVVTVVYIIIGVVVYYYAGSYVASPALGTAGKLLKKVCYGMALPGLLASEMLTLHLSAKYVFIRLLRGTKHLTSNSAIHWSTWLGCTGTTAVIAYVIASGIPVFGGLVSLVGAFLGTVMCFQPMATMWLYDNWAAGRAAPNFKWYFMVCWSIFVIISGTFIMVAGTYGSIVGIIDTYKKDGGSSWSCADNSNSS